MQPIWITPVGSLGTIPEGIFYRIPLQAEAGDQDVLFRLIAGQLPAGVQITTNGFIEGTPKNIVNIQGVATEVAEDVTSRFAIRAYTTRSVNGRVIVDRLADRTFEITVTGQDAPDFVTPAGLVGTFYDGSTVSIQIQVEDTDPNENLRVNLISGALPPGLAVDQTGLIAGAILPLTGPPGTAPAGYDATQYDQFPFDFSTRSTSTNYQFTLEVTDGKDPNVRTFEIFVYSKDSMSADTTDFTADNTFITADVVPSRTPVLITPPGDLGTVRADNFYAFKFDAVDFDGDPIEYSITTGAGIGYDETLFDETGIGFDRGAFSLPPGLQINSDTGWFYGYIPDQGASQLTYRFAIRVLKKNNPIFISDFYYFTITITGDIDTEVIWLTPPNLGVINNGAISTLAVEAVNVGGRSLQYRLASGTNSRLPQGLELFPSGHIVGRVSFNTFALDGGTTTFDKNLDARLDINETTFDLQFRFTVNAFAAQSEQLGYQVSNINIVNGGSGYTSQPTVTISAPPSTENAIQATTGVVTIVSGVITAIEIGNPGQGYLSPPTVTITGGGGSGATATVNIIESNITNAVSVFRDFTITVNRAFNQPYETLYIQAMPPLQDRALIDQLVQNQDIIPENLVYRADDPNFGVASKVIYDHAYGLTASTIEEYVNSLDLNHYWKNLVLGPVRTAQALDSRGNVLYEVVYSEIIDNLVNDQDQSVGKSVTLPYPIESPDSTEITTVYPNSLDNMRTQVVDTVGQISPALPLWMLSKQSNGQVLGFVPAWVICYARPGTSGRIVYNIREQFGEQLNLVDYKVDRYELDRSQTRNWDPENDQWIPSPALATTFDLETTDLPLVDKGNVDYVTDLAFVDVNGRTLDYIASLGGLDGVVGRQINGRTVIFRKQEDFLNLTNDEAFTDYLYPYDSTVYDATAVTYDEAVTLTPAQRLYVYEILVDANNIVHLSVQTVTQPNDSVTIVSGNTFAGDTLYLPNAPTPGLTIATWSYVPFVPSTPTIFDGGSTTFIAPADRWIATDEFNKYLVFPKRTIIG